ncbi:CbtA family protein [Kutzneria kofuensis]|uniref:Phosphate/sulfate permease n=1 Tax=Kutzneria kofuensis TaxID=103725 RepID=A0A7W9KMN8_9PSEU|nr:CbtA family protein [Kutzneria kofuensis]MBB5894649.1 phosphate/sulfate permease [Kutzneria kofuensis]
MEKRIILRGVLAGALAGLLAFVFARIFAEPQIQAAIDYESGRDEAQAALDKAAGLPAGDEGPEIFSRAIQANVGIGVGMVLFGVAMGALFAVAYAVCLGRVGNLRPRTLSVLVAGGGFLGIYLVPFVKYPANPPSIGHQATIGVRGALYVLMMVCSVAFLIGAVVLGKRLAKRFGNWNATLLASLAFVVVIGVVMALLPSLGELAANVRDYGQQATETPQPLRNPAGQIVYPGFPADVLWDFRFYSLAAQAILWAVIGLVFAPLAERLLAPKPAARVTA